MTNELQDFTALITGGAGGIGAATARLLTSRGARVVLTDVDAAAAQASVEALNASLPNSARAERLDVADPDAADDLAERLWADGWGPNAVFANAGIAPSSAAEAYSHTLWRETLSINLDGVFHTLRAFARPLLSRQMRGSFVATSSIAGFGVVSPETHAAYGASKAAVAHLASLLGVEWAARGIRVNAVAPGYTATPILDRLKQEAPDVFAQWLQRIPTGALNHPDEIAEGVAFLFSDRASGITATTLHIDNGYAAR